jgi:tRNA threonylcarbamoyladenosine biosynthesis protein TsaE
MRAIKSASCSVVKVVTRSLSLPSEAATAAMAAQLAAAVSQARFTIHLHGDLGAGKTTFTRYFLHALGVTGRIKSPTYTLVEEYLLPDGRLAKHLDLYRFSSADEWLDAGLDDTFEADCIVIIEWPERAAQLLAAPDLDLRLHATADENARLAELVAHSQAALDALVSLGSV